MEKKMGNKKGILLLFLMLVLAALPLNAQAASQKTKAIKAYTKMMSKSTMRWGADTYYTKVPTKNCEFAIAYIDNDSVPELIVRNTRDITHIAGFGVVYTYRNGKVQVVKNIHIDDKFYYYKKKGVFVSMYVSGGTAESYWTLSKGKAVCRLSKEYRMIDRKYTYYAASKKTSKKKFNAALKKLVGSKKKTAVKFYKNTAAARKKYMK